MVFLKGKEPVPDEILHLGDIDDGQGIHMSVPPTKTAPGFGEADQCSNMGASDGRKCHLETFDKQKCREVM